MDDNLSGCFILIIALAFMLLVSGALTLLLSFLGVIVWSVTNVFIVWGIIILLSLVFK